MIAKQCKGNRRHTEGNGVHRSRDSFTHFFKAHVCKQQTLWRPRVGQAHTKMREVKDAHTAYVPSGIPASKSSSCITFSFLCDSNAAIKLNDDPLMASRRWPRRPRWQVLETDTAPISAQLRDALSPLSPNVCAHDGTTMTAQAVESDFTEDRECSGARGCLPLPAFHQRDAEDRLMR